MKIIGVRTMQDFFSVLLLLTIPILVGVIMFTNIRNLIPAVSVAYATSVFYYLLLFNFSIPERKFTGKMSWFILFIYPLYWLSVSFISWWKATVYCVLNYQKIKAHVDISDKPAEYQIYHNRRASI